MRYLRMIRRFLAVPATTREEDLFKRQTEAWREACSIVRYYYLIHFLFAAQALSWIDQLDGAAPLLIWPVRWMQLAGIEAGAIAVHLFAIMTALVAALWPQKRILRALAWFFFFEVIAFRSSFGYISHGWHAWLWVGLCFVLLPNLSFTKMERSRIRRQMTLTVIWLAQALVLLFYTLTGSWKIVGTVVQLIRGEAHSFSPDALSIQIARSLLIRGTDSILGPFFIEHPILGWPFYVVAIFIEMFALVVAFRPAIQRWWAVCFTAFHILIFLTLYLDFMSQLFLVALLFFQSPFAPKTVPTRDVLRSLPLLGFIWSRPKRAGR